MFLLAAQIIMGNSKQTLFLFDNLWAMIELYVWVQLLYGLLSMLDRQPKLFFLRIYSA